MKELAQTIKLTQYDDLFESTDSSNNIHQGSIEKVSLDILHPFANHPFKLYSDEKMQAMVESVQQNGILMPILIRPYEDSNGYEIISGHNRVEAAKRAGLTDIPSLIRKMDDDTAIIAMIDSNLRQREKLFPSEKAFAYKMKLEVLRRKSGERTDLTSVQVGQRSERKSSREMMSNRTDDSSTQIQRYIRLTELVPQLLDMVDESKLAFNPAVAISYLDKEQQYWFYEIMSIEECSPSLSQADRLKQLAQHGKLDRSAMNVVMTEIKPQQPQIVLKQDRIAKYFPRDSTPQQMEETIIKLLEGWYRKRNQEYPNR